MSGSAPVKTFDSFATSLPKLEGGPIKHSQAPVTTGTSVIALEYDGGVIMAADMLGSYGSLARYRNIPRLLQVNEETVIGCTGDYADFQYLKAIIEQTEIDEQCKDDGFKTSARSLHSWLSRVLYNKRCKFDPLWTTFVVAGVDRQGEEKKPFLGYVDIRGAAYQDPIIATGYGGHMATPLIRKAVEDMKVKEGRKLNEREAREVMVQSLELMYYRDARSHNKYQLAIIPTEGQAKIEDGQKIEGNWAVAHLIRGYE